jgi:hypothetical protein
MSWILESFNKESCSLFNSLQIHTILKNLEWEGHFWNKSCLSKFEFSISNVNRVLFFSRRAQQPTHISSYRAGPGQTPEQAPLQPPLFDRAMRQLCAAHTHRSRVAAGHASPRSVPDPPPIRHVGTARPHHFPS